jgi:ABC-type uncharacterized transport system permease subunit
MRRVWFGVAVGIAAALAIGFGLGFMVITLVNDSIADFDD